MTDRLFFLDPEHLATSQIAERIHAKPHVAPNTLDFIVDRQFRATVYWTKRDGIVNFPVSISTKVLREQRGRRKTAVLKKLSEAVLCRSLFPSEPIGPVLDELDRGMVDLRSPIYPSLSAPSGTTRESQGGLILGAKRKREA